MQTSVESILRNQEANGAIIASPDFDQYHYCWLRDGSFFAYALDRVGEHRRPPDTTRGPTGHPGHRRPNRQCDRPRRGKALDPTTCRRPVSRSTVPMSATTGRTSRSTVTAPGCGPSVNTSSVPGRTKCPRSFTVGRPGRPLSRCVCASAHASTSGKRAGRAAHVDAGLRLRRTDGRCAIAGRRPAFERARSVQSRVRDGAVRVGHYVKSSENDEVDASILWLSTPFRVVSQAITTSLRPFERSRHGSASMAGFVGTPTDTYFGSGAWPVLTASLGWHYARIGDLEAAHRCRDWVADHFDDNGSTWRAVRRRATRSGALPGVGRAVGPPGAGPHLVARDVRSALCSARRSRRIVRGKRLIRSTRNREEEAK